MLDYEKQRKLVILFMIGVVLVVIFLIVSLIVIWTPEPEKELEYQVGVVEIVVGQRPGRGLQLAVDLRPQ